MEPYLFAKDEGGVGIFVGGAQSGLEIDDEVTQLKVEDGYPYQLGISYRRGHALTEAERCVYDFFVRRFA